MITPRPDVESNEGSIMELTKQEIEEELAHKREVIKALIRRRRPLELQSAQKGNNAQPEVLTEIATLTDQIRAQEDEMARLKTRSVEEKIPLEEAEYRAALSAAWQPGSPSVAGAANLELVRLRSGISSEKAQKLEREVRTTLAEEAFYSIRRDAFRLTSISLEQQVSDTFINVEPHTIVPDLSQFKAKKTISYKIEFQTFMLFSGSTNVKSQLHLLGRSIRLDYDTTVRLLKTKFTSRLVITDIKRVLHIELFAIEIENEEEFKMSASPSRNIKSQYFRDTVSPRLYGSTFKEQLLNETIIPYEEEQANFEQIVDRLEIIFVAPDAEGILNRVTQTIEEAYASSDETWIPKILKSVLVEGKN